MKKIREKGITLVALVVTIIILLILAGVTLSLTLNNTGLFKRTQIAVEKTKEAAEHEKEDLDELSWKLDDVLDEDNNEPVPEGMYYSIINGEKKTYYATFQEAYEESVDNGGKYRGGTIVVEKDVTENFEEILEINKTITIDLKLNIMEVNKGIRLTGGTLTVTGKDSREKTGTIRCIENSSAVFNLYNDSNITVTGKPLLESLAHAICTTNDEQAIKRGKESGSTGIINIEGGYIVSTEKSAMGIYGYGPININNATVFAVSSNKNAICCFENSRSNITIGGNSIIANGTEKKAGGVSVITKSGEGTITIKGNTIVTAGLYGTNAINYYKGEELNILDNAKLYTGSDVLHLGIRCNRDENSNKVENITFNTTGGLFSTNESFNNINNINTLNLNLISGQFSALEKEPLLNVKDYIRTNNYPREGTLQTVAFPYLEDYKTLKYVDVPNLYVVKVGN